MNRENVVSKGEEVIYDGQEAWLYRPNPKRKKCWLVIRDGPAIPCDWYELWGGGSMRPRPSLKYESDLDIQVLKLKDSCGEIISHIQCPICASYYVSRFEYRQPISNRCVACKGSGERAMYLEAVVDRYLELIRENKDIKLAQEITDKLNGYHQFEYRRTIRALRDNK